MNCKLLQEVILFNCDRNNITQVGIASALSEIPTLTSFSFSITPNLWYITSDFINSLVCLKGLTCLNLQHLGISDELLYSIARECLPLTSLVLHCCDNYSYAGIFCLLSKRQGIQHLDLQNAYFLNNQHVINLSLLLGDLLSINLSHCYKITKLALFALAKNCPSLSEIKMDRIGNEIVENSESSMELGVYPQLKSLYLCNNSWLSDENIITYASIFPNLQLLDLSSCDRISKGICEVLRRCCNIRHLNLAECSRVKLIGMNFLVPKLEVWNLSSTKVNDKTLSTISKNCRGLLQLLLKHCDNVRDQGLKHVEENCTQLMPSWLVF